MATVEKAVDAAAEFIEPYLERTSSKSSSSSTTNVSDPQSLVNQALFHLQVINTAEQAQEPDAPYDGSLFGVAYGLLDIITTLGLLPFLSPDVAFGQRPRSVLKDAISTSPSHDDEFLDQVITKLLPILNQDGSGVQPLLSQRILPDVLSALAELALSPRTKSSFHATYEPSFRSLLASTSTSRLLPILTSFLGQEIPPWLRQPLAKELALIPLRAHGVRHTVEFLSLSYLSKNAKLPEGASSEPSQIPIPLEAITHVSRLLSAAPSGMNVDDWFTQLAPQLWALIDGKEGTELSRAAGQIVSGGILNRKSTGAPGTIGWTLFVRPLLETISPPIATKGTLRKSTSDRIFVDDVSLNLALRRLSVIITSSNHSGLIKRLVSPLILPLWGLMAYAKSRVSLNTEWSTLSRKVLLHYLSAACDPKRVDQVAQNLFWDGSAAWSYGPGAEGGVEIRQRRQDDDTLGSMNTILAQIGALDERIKLFIDLLVEAKTEDEAIAFIFLQTTQRWLSTGKNTDNSKLITDDLSNPLAALAEAKLSEALATKFQDQLARQPQHILEFMSQLISGYVEEHKTRTREIKNAGKLSRASLRGIVSGGVKNNDTITNSDTEDLTSFALSILNNLIGEVDLTSEAVIQTLTSIVPLLQYLSHSHPDLPIQPLITNASANILHVLQKAQVPVVGEKDEEDLLHEQRDTLKTVLTDLTSPEPPNRTWAITTLRKLILDPNSFKLIDIPATTHALLSASIADPESYVHSAAIPVVVDLAVVAPTPTLRILVDAFVDVSEQSLRLKDTKEIEQALDYRLRVGEILHRFVGEDAYWVTSANVQTRYSSLKMLVEASLSLASRRGQRHQTLSKRNELAEAEKRMQEEGEEAWGGPIPNLLDPDGENADQPERDALLKIIEGWEDTGIEEDVRIRSSALSLFARLAEQRLDMMSKAMLAAGLQMVLQILVVEKGDAKAILRRAALFVIVGTLKGMDVSSDNGELSSASLDMREIDQIVNVTAWVKDEDADPLARSHAQSILEDIETWRMKQIYKIRDEGLRMTDNLGLDGTLRGLDIEPLSTTEHGKKGKLVQEIE
ncbi:hypothetical protein BU24DRAFT_418359 [Aaosphaeria arxii CBS 175.79]|uniref:RNA polymerase II assembly factor Rtp1 C-terminal domain-containing protein n=1 Tax=Aaosphaeria arxii CBS 175.79 TaxID=1450172 RepID=A0A6A5XZW0_9PLEO|nr:uncharacterized protein BU24DRAFT_418359 [Aaosphaeria arxii CBS 175.79]KAF2018805.1 hypothetical protein BU24DRAFT_418359 [Aaosphaeria arxii CBS 175.79]